MSLICLYSYASFSRYYAIRVDPKPRSLIERHAAFIEDALFNSNGIYFQQMVDKKFTPVNLAFFLSSLFSAGFSEG